MVSYFIVFIIWLLSGFVLSNGVFYCISAQVNLDLHHLRNLKIIVVTLFTFLFAFSKSLRTTAFLILPNFFNKRGRTFLLSLTFAFAIIGPGQNLLQNIDKLQKAVACSHLEANKVLKDVLFLIFKPYSSIREILKKMMVNVQQSFIKLKQIIKETVDITFNICEYFLEMSNN